MTATPRPWTSRKSPAGSVDLYGGPQFLSHVAQLVPPYHPEAVHIQAYEDAALICRAVNAHEELVAFVREMEARCSVWGDPDSSDAARQHLYALGAEARALLARIKAEEA